MEHHFPGHMGDCSGEQRLQTRVHGLTTFSVSSETHTATSQQRAMSRSASGGCISSSEERHCTNSTTLHGGLLVDVFSGPEKNRGLEAYSQSETVKQIHQAKTVSDGDIGLGLTLSNQKQMDSVLRLEGCLPPHSYCTSRSEMVALQGERSGVYVSVPSVRPIHRPQGVYAGGQGGRGLLEAQGCQSVSVSRRLVDLRGVRDGHQPSNSASCSDSNQIGFYHQSQEIQSGPDTVTHLSGSSARPHEGSCHPYDGKGVELGRVCPHPSGSGLLSSCSLAQSTWSHGQYGGFGPLLSFSHAYNTNPPVSSLQTQFSPGVQSNPYVGPSSQGITMVAGQNQSDDRYGFSMSEDGSCRDDRRVQFGLGRPSFGQPSFGAMDSSGSSGSHQSSRTVGCGTIHPQVREIVDRTQCPHSVGQHNGGCIYKQTGRNEILLSVCSHPQTAHMVSAPQHNREGHSHCRDSQCPRRRPLQGEVVRPDGAISSSACCPDDIRKDLPSDDRSFCVQPQQATPRVLLETPRRSSIRGGRSVHRLDRDDSIRFPSYISTSSSGGENRTRGMQRHPCRPLLAKTPVVSANGRSASRPSMASSRNTRLTAEHRGRSSGRESADRTPEVDCLAIIRQRCQERGFSERAASLIAAGRRPSTLRTYSKRLAPYYQWCRERDISPSRASVNQIAQFLSERFDSGLQSATIRNYKSAILSIHRGFDDGTTINDDGTIRLLLEGMFNERPPTRVVIPSWDLNTVLERIKEPPFEPLNAVTLKYLTLKTVFLVALASAARCSEIHALSASATVINRAGVSLCFRPDFLAKNENSRHSHSAIFLPRMSDSSSVREDRFWCPVRSLKYYLDKTSIIRGNTDQLFVTHAEPHGPASKQTIARWIAQVLLNTNALLEDQTPRAHSTRAIAASWAYHRGLSVAQICEAVSWRASSTFTSAYYKNVQGQSLRGSFARTVLAKKH